jgi:glycosyltransferase involved in cell wall biosynthesis
MSKIKVAQVITRMDWGGSPDIVSITCSRLDPELYDVTLVVGQTRYPSVKMKEFLKKWNSKIVSIPQLRRNINPIYDLYAFIKLYSLFRSEKFDIVHTHTAKAGVLGRIAAYFSGRPVIIHTPHGHNFYGYFGPIGSKMVVIIERLLGRFSDKIICLTELEKKDYIRFKIAKEDKLSLIHLGLELDDYDKPSGKSKIKIDFNIGPEENLVAMIGRLEPVKGPQYFVKAAVEVAKQNNITKFILIGEGSLRKTLEEKVGKLGFNEKIIFAGWREDIPEILSDLDILVLPSLNEAVGMVLIEAQAKGMAVIATNVGGIPEIVKDKQTGILVRPGDYLGLARAINHLLADREKRLVMGQAGKEWVRSRFKAEEMVSNISGIYQKLIKQKNVKP